MRLTPLSAIWLISLSFLPFGTPLHAKKGGEEIAFAVGNCSVFFRGLKDQESLCALKAATLNGGLTFKTARGESKIADLKLQQQKERWVNTLLYLGYLDAKLSLHIDDANRAPKIDVLIQTGALYSIAELEILVNEGPIPAHLQHFVPQVPCTAKTSSIQGALEKILNGLQSGGYPFAKIENQLFDVLGLSADLKARISISTGPFCLFGNFTIGGIKRVSERFVSKRMRFAPNEPFDLFQVDESRKELQASGLFNSVTIALKQRESALSGPCFIDLDVALDESKPRSFGVGLSQIISQGIGSSKKWDLGLRTEWSHRNLRGMGESIYFNTLLSRYRRNVLLQYAQPVDTNKVPTLNQLRVAGNIDQGITRSYDATSWSLGVYLDHQLSPLLNFSNGLKIEQIATHGDLVFPKTSLLTLPLSLTWTNSSDLFDPRQGAKCSVLFTPLMDLSAKKRCFSKQEVQIARYLSFKRLTLALSAQIANFWGIRWSEVPPSLRYFLGSSNAMRGYAYKSLSPLDDNNKLTGGSSMVTFIVEPRIHLNSHFSLVPFLEWGRVYLSNLPKRHLPLLRSVGLGAYIRTPIGPLRFDCATPIDRRKDIDRSFQIYMSLGSSF